MLEQYRKFDELKPEQALDIVAQVIEPGYLDFLRHVRIAMDEQSGYVSLFAPQSYRRGQRQIGAQFLQLMQTQYEAITSHPPQFGAQLPEGTLPLSEGTVKLLYLTHSEMWQQKLKDVVATEYLLIGVEQSDTAELMEQLRIHATHTKISKGITPDKTYTLFHVADDQKRGSTFSSLMAAGLFDNWHLLKAVTCEDYRLFLPRDIWPNPETLAAFCRLLQNVPLLFSQQPLRSDHRLLAALIQSGEDSVELIFLRPLFFNDQLALSPSVAGYTHLTICDLADSPQKMEQLHDEVELLERRVGYRLELRATRFREDVDVEWERLQREQHELTYEIALIEAYSLSRPKLLRFTSAQLAAMGDYLSHLPGNMLREGKLLYGFQATDHDPEGLHFLYIAPTVKEPDLDPLLRWSALDSGRPMRFHLDPFWAKYYSGKNRSKLFVPEFTTLFPAIHDWNVEQGKMDDYLQKTIRHWLQERPGADPYEKKPFPQTPVYVFDGPCDPWADIGIYILDLATFQPLYTYLGWLNDNLILRQARPVEPIMEQVAADIFWTDIAQQMSQRRGEVEQNFVAISSQLTQAIAGHTAILMQTLTQKLEQLQVAANKQRQAISELQPRLDQLTALYRQLASIAQQAEQQEAGIRQQMNEFHQIDKTIRDEVEVFRQKATRTIEETSRQIDSLLAELRKAYEWEEQKLDSLNRSSRRW